MSGNPPTDERVGPYMGVPPIPSEAKLDTRALFANGGMLELEVGFGRGRFIIDRACIARDKTVLGIETKRKMVHHTMVKAEKLKLTNLVVLHGDARFAMERMVPDASIENIFINFPDPWWKAKHQKRMVVTKSLVGHAARLLKPGGRIMVQTDVDFRAEAYLKVLRGEGLLEPDCELDFSSPNPFEARSSRERESQRLGMPIFRLIYRRVAHG